MPFAEPKRGPQSYKPESLEVIETIVADHYEKWHRHAYYSDEMMSLVESLHENLKLFKDFEDQSERA